MAKHTLWCDHHAVDLPQFTEVFCAVCDDAWPCFAYSEYKKELHRRHAEKSKAPVRMEHGAHAAGGSPLDELEE